MEIIENYNWNFVWIFGSFLFFIIYGVTIFVLTNYRKAYIDITVEAIVEVLIHGRNNGQGSLCICLRLLNKI